MNTLLAWLGSLLGGPFVNAALAAYRAKLDRDGGGEKLAAELAAKEITLQQRELELQTKLRIAQIGAWYEPEKIMGYAVAVYVCKLLIWDKVLGLGSTDPLVGWIEVTANIIVAAYFGKRGIENVAKILKR